MGPAIPSALSLKSVGVPSQLQRSGTILSIDPIKGITPLDQLLLSQTTSVPRIPSFRMRRLALCIQDIAISPKGWSSLYIFTDSAKNACWIWETRS